MSATQEVRKSVCQGCGVEIPLSRRGRARKWCSGTCRQHTMYGGTCVDCGAPTYSGTVPPSERCNVCRGRARTVWTDEAIISAIRRWADIHGEPPRATVWLRAAERGRDYPPVSIVLQVFGTWNAAIRRADLTPRRQGAYGRAGEDMELCREIRARYEAGESSVALASEYGCNSKTIAARVVKAGGRMRSYAEAWELRREQVAA